MVYGNVNDNSGTGVLFTRNPANGINELYGEFLINAQGEDVVAGIRWAGVLACWFQHLSAVYCAWWCVADRWSEMQLLSLSASQCSWC
jgi:pyruvate,orthophosphate dikinase